MDNIQIFAFADEVSMEIDRQIAAMKRNHLDGLEIRGVDGENISDISLEKAREVRAKLNDAGLIVWSIGSPIGKIHITDPFEAHLDKYRHTLEIASVLEAENIRMFSFYIPKGEKPSAYRNAVFDRLGVILELAKNSGIHLCHENEKGIYGDNPERCLDLFQTLPDLKGIFDPANFVQCGIDTLAAWDQLNDHIRYLHIKDARTDGQVVPAGSGMGNVQKITQSYLARGGHWFTMEPHLTVFEGLHALEREGEESGIAAFRYPNSDVAFDTACGAFKALLP